jgi:hypothetical protein
MEGGSIMRNRALWIVVPLVLILLLAALPAAADGAVWRGEYYNNQWLTGAPAMTRDDPSVNFNWGTGSPGWPIPSDHFSARWTRNEHFSGGNYRFHVTTDDGARLWVDSHLLIDQWHNQSAATYEAVISLSPGTHFLRLEHYEERGDAVIHCWWDGDAGGIGFADWRAEYFNNIHLGGAPVLRRNDPHINFEWGVHSPGPGVDSEDFSVRWTRTQHFDAATYRFTATVDDGVRVWVDGHLVIDEWSDHPVRTYSGDLSLTAGDHRVQVEYYEKGGHAVAKLSWERVGAAAPASGEWHAEFFNNTGLAGAPVLTRSDWAIDFNWGWGSPDYRIPGDHFSARWTGTIWFDHSRTWTFSARSDDGVRMWVDGSLVIDAWSDHSPTTFTAARWLSAGNHSIRVEYYERTGTAEIKVWRNGAPSPPPPPSVTEIVVDEQSPGFVWGGSLHRRYNAWLGYGGHIYYMYNNRYSWSNYAKWIPRLPRAGYYEVYAYIPGSYSTTGAARYRVLHNGIRNDKVVNQGWYANQWVSLGTHYFNAWNVSREFVLIYNNTREWPGSRYIGVDAVKFVAR